MQELKEKMEGFISPKELMAEEKGKEFPESKEATELRNMSKRWAKMCVDTHSGKLLEKGLKVTIAICDYLNEIEQPTQ